MMPDADYARTVAYLDRARLPAYVSFVEESSTSGVARDRETPRRIYVRTSDGAVVKTVPPSDAPAGRSNIANSGNPFSRRSYFDPQCYVPKREDHASRNGQTVLRFELQSTCKSGAAAPVLYADPQTFRPIALEGDFSDSAEPEMAVAIELRYTTVGRYVVPEAIHVHAVGQGWLFWVRERADVRYTGYEFSETPPDAVSAVMR